jgi:hypothetical protein
MSSWTDISEIQNELDAALNNYQWNSAAGVCDHLIHRIYEEPSPYPEFAARNVLDGLRKKRRFTLAARVAEALIRSGQNAPRVRRQYAQALIDQDILLAAEPVLQTLANEPLEGDSQVAEARGLLARIYKQLYVNADTPSSSYARVFFERALSEYFQVYRLDPHRYTWHGINVVALLHRGKADGIGGQHLPIDDLAHRVLDALSEPSKAVEAFQLATRVEAFIALARYTDAESAALEYIQHPDTDAFEVGSTLRQLEQVWRLTTDSAPGSTILPVLRAAKLRSEGGALNASPKSAQHELSVVREALKNLEKRFGDDRTVTLHWYETGLQRSKSVARMERLSGKAQGTGWLVRSEDFFPNGFFADGKSRLLLLTNSHIVNGEGSGGALLAEEVRANFQGLGIIVEFESKVVWSSPIHDLDATFLAFKNDPPAVAHLPISGKKIRFTDPPSRVYIIGHPGGRDLEFSIHDNVLLGCNDRLLHYRAATEGGSSGSPVFEAEAWRAVGLHHGGGTLNRLDGKQPPYEANEGITVRAIRARIAEQAVSSA